MLGKALKQIRLFHQYKQVELARELGISKSYLSEIESGRKQVTLDLLNKYSTLFNIPASSLLLFSENMASPKVSDKLRRGFTSKILTIMEWANSRNEIKA